MFKLRAALAALTVVAACNRSDSERQVPASQPPSEHQDVAGARQPPTRDTTAPDPPRAPSTHASRTLARKHAAAPVHRRKSVPARPEVAQRPESASAPVAVNAPPSVRRDSVPSTDSMTARDSTRTSDSSSSSSSSDTSATSDTLGYSPYAGSATPPAAAAHVVAAGTVIPVSLEDSISSRHDTWGKQLAGKVMQNITGPNGEVLVRAGSPLRLTVSRLRSGRGKSRGDIALQADSITVEGRAQKLEAKVESVPYELKGRGVTGEDAAKVGVGAAGGAVVGGVITGKTKGAVIGGVVGAAAGAAVASQTSTRDVVVAARTPVRVVLTAPLVIR